MPLGGLGLVALLTTPLPFPGVRFSGAVLTQGLWHQGEHEHAGIAPGEQYPPPCCPERPLPFSPAPRCF